jgi:hypothetical protein
MSDNGGSGTMFGLAGLLMALCCIAALAAVLLPCRLRAGSNDC